MKKNMMKFATCLMTAALLTGIFPAEQVRAAAWEMDGTGWKYQQDDGSYPAGRWELLGDQWYYFDTDGYMKTDWFSVNDKWYYADASGAMTTGWKILGGAWYYFDESGAMTTEWKQIGGQWYYFGSDGKMTFDWQDLGGKWYYFDGSGAMTTGWAQLGGQWYYFGPDGAMTFDWQDLGGKWYYFDGSGAMTTGWAQLGGQWYYFSNSGAMTTGWLQLHGRWYYMDESGAMYKNRWLDGKYFLGADGSMMINSITPDGCYVDANGVYIFEDPVILHSYYTGLTSSQAAQADAVAWEIANTILEKLPADSSDIDKVYAAAYVISNLYCTPDRYDTDANGYYRSPYGPFVAGVFTCAGATRALGRVLDYMGFHWKHMNENQYTHQWCVLFMDGELGYADASGAPIVGYGDHPFM